MTHRLDPNPIAEAMAEAGWIALHGAPEQKAGVFQPALAQTGGEPVDQPTQAAREA